MRTIDYFDKAVAEHPDRPALADGPTLHSYSQLARYSRLIAQAMYEQGFTVGDKVAAYSPNDPTVLMCMLGTMRAGGVWSPINENNALDSNLDYLALINPRWLFYHSSVSHALDAIQDRVPTLQHTVCMDNANRGCSLKGFLAAEPSPGEPDWGDACGNIDQPVGLFETGGTTGAAKAVMFRMLDVATDLEVWRYHVPHHDHPVFLIASPLARVCQMAVFMLTLGATVIVQRGFNTSNVLREIAHSGVTHLFLPPTGLYSLLAHPDVEEGNYSSLSMLLLGGAPVSPDILRRAVTVFGSCICQVYGQVDAGTLAWLDADTIAQAARGVHPERLRGCGKPCHHTLLSVMNERGELLSPHQMGEIVVRSTSVKSYYAKPEETIQARAHGWHHTGDLGYFDDDGYFYVAGRGKDMIVTAGFNVFATEVEFAILGIPEIQECVVIGVPDDLLGEAVKAIVVLRGGDHATEESIIEHCRSRLGRVKAPRSVEFRRAIPATSAGKPDKKLLRRPYWTHCDRDVH